MSKGNNPLTSLHSLCLFLYRGMMIPSNYKNNIVTRTSISSKHPLAPSSFCIMLLCYLQRGLNRIFREKNVYSSEEERPFLIKSPVDHLFTGGDLCSLTRSYVWHYKAGQGAMCSPPSVSRAGTCWKVICLFVFFSFSVSFLWVVITSTIYNFVFSL